MRFAWTIAIAPKTTASSGTTIVQPNGMPMMPSTSDATEKPLALPAASGEVPSIVNGMPQCLQLLAVIGLGRLHLLQMMICLPVSSSRRIAGARSPAAA